MSLFKNKKEIFSSFKEPYSPNAVACAEDFSMKMIEQVLVAGEQRAGMGFFSAWRRYKIWVSGRTMMRGGQLLQGGDDGWTEVRSPKGKGMLPATELFQEQRSFRPGRGILGGCHHCGLVGHWKAECSIGLLCFTCR